MSSLNSIRFAWSGDNATIEADFYADREGNTPSKFNADVDVRWHIVSFDGAYIYSSFDGSRDPIHENRLIGTASDGVPSAGKYKVFAEVTDNGNKITIPGAGAQSLVLSIDPAPVPGGDISPPSPNNPLLQWIDYVTGYSETPQYTQTIASGDVYTYTYTNGTLYRLVPSSQSSEPDSFYTTFSDGVLSVQISSKEIQV